MKKTRNAKESLYITIATSMFIAVVAIIFVPRGIDWFNEMMTKLPGA